MKKYIFGFIFLVVAAVSSAYALRPIPDTLWHMIGDEQLCVVDCPGGGGYDVTVMECIPSYYNFCFPGYCPTSC